MAEYMSDVKKAKSNISAYIAECEYTYSVGDIISEYIKKKTGSYVSFTANAVIGACKKDLEALAFEALREKQERDNPQPLTLDELRRMDGEPVWVEEHGATAGEWCIVNSAKQCVTEKNGDVYYFFEYEGVWIAYRHKQEVAP